MVELFPLTNTSSVFGPGADNGYGDKANGGHDTSTGVRLDPNLPHGAAPMRNQLKRIVDHLEGRPIDPRYPVKGDYTLGFKDGKVAAIIQVDVGGLDKKGTPTADQDLVHNAAKAMGMQPQGTSGLGNNKGATYVSFATASAFADIKEEDKPAMLAEAKALLAIAEEQGRFPIYRKEANPVNKELAGDFSRRLVKLEKQVYDAPKVATLNKASQIAKDFNEGKVGLEAFKEVSATDLRPDLIAANTTNVTTQIPADIEVAKPTAGAAAYAYVPKTVPLNKERAERTLTAGLERQAADESNEDYVQRKKQKVAENFSFMSPEERQLYAPFFTAIMALILFAVGETEAASALLEGMSPSAIAGREDQFTDALRSTGTGGRRYNPQTQDYDGENAPSSAKILGNYSKIVDPATFADSDTTLKSKGSFGNIRDAIKQEYTSRLNPYLFQGDIADIPAGVDVVVLDLGHLANGTDLGAGMMTSGGYLCEAGACLEANLATAKRLTEQGVIVVSTSQSPRFETNTLSPPARKQFTQAIADEVGEDRVFFISSHFNDTSSASTKGASMYVDTKNSASVAYAQEIQGALTQSGLFTQFSTGVISETKTQHGGLSVTTNSYPSVLAEYGFLKGDAEKLANKEYMQNVGNATADAVINVGTQKFAWKVEDKTIEVAEKAPAPKADEAVPANEFAKLFAGKSIKLPEGMSLPNPQDKPTSLTDAAAVVKENGVSLKPKPADGFPPPDASVAVTPDSAAQAPAVGS